MCKSMAHARMLRSYEPRRPMPSDHCRPGDYVTYARARGYTRCAMHIHRTKSLNKIAIIKILRYKEGNYIKEASN